MDIKCANCGDIIEQVDNDYELVSIFQHFSYKNNEKIVVETRLICCRGSD